MHAKTLFENVIGSVLCAFLLIFGSTNNHKKEKTFQFRANFVNMSSASYTGVRTDACWETFLSFLVFQVISQFMPITSNFSLFVNQFVVHFLSLFQITVIVVERDNTNDFLGTKTTAICNSSDFVLLPLMGYPCLT